MTEGAEPTPAGAAGERATLGHRLREARESAGLSQGQAGKLMGMHRPTIGEIEAGRRRVAVDELRAFAEVYQVSFAWLAGEEDAVAGNARVQLVAREFAKLKKDDLERLIDLFTILKNAGESPE